MNTCSVVVGRVLNFLLEGKHIDSVWRPGMLGLENQMRFDEFTDEWEALYPDMDDPLTVLAVLLYIRELMGNPHITTLFCEKSEMWELSTPMAPSINQCHPIKVHPQVTERDLITFALVGVAQTLSPDFG